MRTLLLAGFLVCVGFSVTSAIQTPGALTEANGVLLMRQLMSVQANAPFKGNAGSLTSVVEEAQRTMPPTSLVAAIDPASGEVLDYVVRITPSDDGKRYAISLTPKRGCTTAWFGDDTNVIYAGKAMGCR